MKLASIALVAVLASCASTSGAFAVSVAQAVLEPYSFTVNGEARGGMWVNSKFLAIDAEVELVAEYRGTNPETGQVEVLWRRSFRRGEGQRAYKALFGVNGKFISVVPATWAEARASMPHMPPEE